MNARADRFPLVDALRAIAALAVAVSYYGLERPLLSPKRLVGRPQRVTPGEALVEPAPARPGG